MWGLDYESFKGSPQEQQLEQILNDWSYRTDLKETSAESALIDIFFKTLWGYRQSGHDSQKDFSIYPKFPVKGGGQGGGIGYADLALGWFEKEGVPPTAQVMCEFKDIKSNLDAPQKSRKSNTRSPVKQCIDYLGAARRELYSNDLVLPTWGIVTDMNEFRLYWYDRSPQQYFQFVIQPSDLFQGESLISETENARFDRFLFWKLFSSDTLLSTGGKSKLEQVIAKQWVVERELENVFYTEYRSFREKLYKTLIEHNPDFPGTKGKLVRVAQKILDRFIFIFYCEDMGHALSFPPQLLRDFLMARSRDEYFDPNAFTLWSEMLLLFKAFNEGKSFGNTKLDRFNGGLFANDIELENLKVPNSIFCRKGQAQNEASLYSHTNTVLYLSASYNYSTSITDGLSATPIEESDPAKALKSDPTRSLGLYTLGRIFEQSITELEILEAEADGFLSLNKESKRKREGVYYTPELIVERIINETLGPLLSKLKIECDWPEAGLPDANGIEKYQERLKNLKIVDPACGSGAFLISALRYLIDEWHSVLILQRDITGTIYKKGDSVLIKEILSRNIYGVDINPASVEIARLALWLHTASGDKPLSSLDHTIRDGNSLIGSEFYKGQLDIDYYDEVQKERVNTFDWNKAFPEVAQQGGFDAVVGNPPYVKLQNFKKVHADMAKFLKNDNAGFPTYKSTQVGNFDLYLPFIEKGIQLLNENGRLGYIAPSLWTVNEYGEPLRNMILESRSLESWIDFKAHQVFDEAITYTALQFFTKKPNKEIKVSISPDGKIPDNAWPNKNANLPYEKIVFENRWLLLTGEEHKLLEKIYKNSTRLGSPENTSQIYQGIITSADHVYHFKKLGAGHYLGFPKAKNASPFEVELEDSLMKPLVSGGEAKRYEKPRTETYLLFPYARTDGLLSLIDQPTLEEDFPKIWSYLNSYSDSLQKREALLTQSGGFRCDANGIAEKAPFYNDEWYRFGRPQNLEKQEIEKLVVAQTVPSLRVFFDDDASLYLNNVRVNGISVSKLQDPWFLLGILNAPVCNYVFQKIGKVKAGGYFEANKQFIAPLPIPKSTKKNRSSVADCAKNLQSLYTNRRQILKSINARIETIGYKNYPETFLFPSLLEANEYIEHAPKQLGALEKSGWAKQKYSDELQALYDEVSARLHPSAALDACYSDGELRFLIDHVEVLSNIYVNDEVGVFILAQWKIVCQTFSITEKTNGKKLCNTLRKLSTSKNKTIISQIVKYESKLENLEKKIAELEKTVNSLTYKLYGLTEKEIRSIDPSYSK
ncbi:MAG: hypothetical protein DHS20C12_02460 [Pseudohongiella sp.]|nr:MAG: hypothetical protein DHS20C12_02460 [Pseudohongiella sp.]